MNVDPLGNREIDPKALRSLTRFAAWLFGLIFLFVVVTSLLTPYTNYLWFVEDAHQPRVFTTTYTARGQLFLLAWIPTWALLFFSLNRALKTSMVYLQKPDTFGQILLANAVRYVQVKGATLVRLGAPVAAFLLALGFSNSWQAWLLSKNAQPFGRVDPTFGKDIGFFVFTLPWWQTLVAYAQGALVLTTVLTIGIYAGMQALALFAKIELGRPHIRTHLCILVGSLIVFFGLNVWLKCYEVGFVPGTQFTGAGFAASQQVRVQFVIAALTAILGVLTMVSGKMREPYRVPISGGGALVVFAVLGLGAYPTILQRFRVDPDKLAMEGPYAKRAIAETRFGFGLDQIDVRDETVADEPTDTEVNDAKETLDNMRLWDPEVVRQAIESIQTLRPYYTFQDVDIDRYVIGGRKRMVMLAPRDIQLNGLSDNAQTWVNQRIRFTHGFGVVASPVNSSTPMGQPNFLIKDMPPKGIPELELKEPRLYFSDFRDAYGSAASEYAIVNTKVSEFDYPSEQGETTHRWTGKGGIHLSNMLVRAAFATILGDGNLLVSGNISDESRLLLRRSVLERAQMVYPFLRFDQDPYIVISEGRVKWILDGYTSTDMVPYSARIGGGEARLNYIRNAAKIVIDAYDGSMDAYSFAKDEPLLKAWAQIYPGLIRPREEFPKPLEAHIRYPEDMLRIQSAVLSEYHVTEPTSFLSNGDAWDVAYERGLSGQRESMRPYYVQIVLPGEKEARFQQILPFTPRSKTNMSGWLSAECDPGDYGKLVLFRYTKGAQINGPAQMEAIFNQDRVIADINRQFENEQSQIVVGNLLVIPIGRSVMYVEPLFLKSKTSGIQAPPELKKVILALKGKVVVGDSYEEALEKLFGSGKSDNTEPKSPGPKPVSGSTPVETDLKSVAKEAMTLCDKADAALRSGDFAGYGQIQKQLKEKLRQLVR